MDLANPLLRPHLDHFVIVLIDDIFIYSKSQEEHEQHISIALQTLRQEKLYARFSKCKSSLEIVASLGYVISKDSISR